jgi:hypothetical protein
MAHVYTKNFANVNEPLNKVLLFGLNFLTIFVSKTLLPIFMKRCSFQTRVSKFAPKMKGLKGSVFAFLILNWVGKFSKFDEANFYFN